MSMEFMKNIWESAKSDRKKIVLPEGDEDRTLIASEKINKEGLADIILVGSSIIIKAKAKVLGVDIEGIQIEDPETSSNTDKYAEEFYELRKKKGMTKEKALKIVKDPLYYGTMMVKMNDANGMVSGAIDRKSVV